MAETVATYGAQRLATVLGIGKDKLGHGQLSASEVQQALKKMGLRLPTADLRQALELARSPEPPPAAGPAEGTLAPEPVVGQTRAPGQWALVVPRPARMHNQRLVRAVLLTAEKTAPTGTLELVDVIVRDAAVYRPGIILAVVDHAAGPGLCRLNEKREPQAWLDTRFPGHPELLRMLLQRLSAAPAA
jgi:hypothetical protein